MKNTIKILVALLICSAIANGQIIVTPARDTACAGSDVYFNAVSYYPPTVVVASWSWYKGPLTPVPGGSATLHLTSVTPSMSDSFWVIATFVGGGSAYSNKVYLTVDSLNTGIVSGPSAVCVGSTITLTDSITGGTWSSSSSSIATVGSTGIVTGGVAGTAIISYIVTGGCGSLSVTHPITVNPLPNAGTITGATAVCVGSTITLTESVPTGPPGGGSWSSSSSPIATVSSTGILTGVVSGTATISFTVTGSCGSVSATHPITVNPLPITGTITGPITVCLGSTITLTDSITGGSWSSSSSPIATVGSTGIVTGDVAGTATISYTLTNGCGTASATQSITVNPIPIAGTITGSTAVCVGSTIALTDGVAGGLWYSLSSSIATVGSTGIVTGVVADTTTISYTVTNGCGTASATYPITVNPLPITGTITGSSIACAGSTIALTDGVAGGTWSSSSSPIATVGSTGIVTGVVAGTATISYTVINGCGTASATQPVTVNPLPIAGTITGSDSVCIGSSITLMDAVPGGTWSAILGLVSVSGGIVTGITAGIDSVFYTVTNICGSSSSYELIYVDPCIASGVKNISQSEEIIISPNPTQSNITISSSVPLLNVCIRNMLGQIVYAMSFNDKSINIDVRDLSSGMYFVKVNGGKVNKLIKQ